MMIHFTKEELRPVCLQHTSGQYFLTKDVVRKIIQTYKKHHKCEMCGIKENLTFHHTKPEKKKYNISDIYHKQATISLKALIKELNKCELLCDKCHKEVEKNKLLNITK